MTNQKIRQVAMELFGRYGYEETSLVDIANGVGIKKPSIYNHYESKEALFLAILDDVLDRETQSLQELVDNHGEGDSCEQKLNQVYQHLCQTFGTTIHGLFWKRAIFFPPEPFKKLIKEKFLDFEKKIDQILLEIFQAGIQRNEIRNIEHSKLLASFYCFVDGLFVEHHYYEAEVLRFRMEASWEIFWAGIKEG